MAMFKFIRPSRPKSPPSRNVAMEAAIQAQRGRLFQASAMTVSALDALQASSSPDVRVTDAINAIRDLICDAVLALDPARLRHATMTAANTRKV